LEREAVVDVVEEVTQPTATGQTAHLRHQLKVMQVLVC
jgi:hypothetical protein